MIGRRALFSALGATGLLFTRHATAQTNSAARPFNGLVSGLSDLSRLSRAKSRSISPENFTGEKGKGGQADRGHRRQGVARPRPGLEDLAVGPHRARRRRSRWPTSQGPGAIQHIWMTPTGPLALLHPAHLLGRRDDAVGRVPGRRLLRLGLGQVRARSARCAVCVNPGSAFNCYWEMPFRKSVPDHAGEHRATRR